MEESILKKRTATPRWLQLILGAVAALAGSATGILAAISFGFENVVDASDFTGEELANITPWGWVGRFTGDTVRADLISRNVAIAAGLSVLALAAMIAMFVLTGRHDRGEDGSIRLNWFDRLWTEFQIFVFIMACTGAVGCCYPVAEMVRNSSKIGPFDYSAVYEPLFADDYIFGISNVVTFWLAAAGLIACLSIALTCIVSMVKKIKARRLLGNSLLGTILKAFGFGISAVGGASARAMRRFAVPADTEKRVVGRMIVKYCLLVIVLMALPGLIGALFSSWGVWLLCQTAAALIACLLVTSKIIRFNDIRAGVLAVRSGDLSYRIPVNEDELGPKSDLDKLASDINHISEATDIAVQNELKNQRLRTDLISNVSHDLKTPLTSMISYLDILEKEGLDSEDAPEHLRIVRDKTERLRTLTDELFEAAKVSSGNVPCEITDIDLNALIDQSIAEMEDRLSTRHLDIRKSVRADSAMVRADGKLLYRVLENLLSNISKYALDGSRVYIDISEPAGPQGRIGKVLLEVKNISQDALNISADELMERFTRGDASRNTEGSGLGLAIAKDLTTLMGGAFGIRIDGDMFKTTILLDEA